MNSRDRLYHSFPEQYFDSNCSGHYAACKGYRIQEVRVVDQSGRRVAGFPAEVFVRATHGSFITLARGDLAASIFEKIEGKVEAILGDSVIRIDQSARAVRVTFESGAARDFDLVVGADGLHSRVRELVFGAQSQFEHYLGYNVAAFEAEGYEPRDELAYVLYTEVGQQVAQFAMRDCRTLFLFTFASPTVDAMNMAAQKALLRKRFGKQRVGVSSDFESARLHKRSLL